MSLSTMQPVKANNNSEIQDSVESTQALTFLQKTDLQNPSTIQKEKILNAIRDLTMDDIEEFYTYLLKKNQLEPPTIPDNYLSGDVYEQMRISRRADYVSAIFMVANDMIDKLPSNGIVCDIGCGNGIVTKKVLDTFIKKGGTIYACDVVNYLHESVSEHIQFSQKDGLTYLKQYSDNFFDGIMETATLHHLPTIRDYKRYLREMIRVLKHGGPIILLETTHSSWREQLRNAVLDIISNDTTSRMLTKERTRSIPVPIRFLSHQEILNELKKNGIKEVSSYFLPPNSSAPQLHRVYAGRKA